MEGYVHVSMIVYVHAREKETKLEISNLTISIVQRHNNP